jgi:hypothetical protein
MGLVGFFSDIARDLTGKGQIRLIVQPAIALALGIPLGLADAKQGERPLMARILGEKRQRKHLIKTLFKRAAVPFTVAIALDCFLQYATLHRVRPVAAVVVGCLLVLIPYSMARGFTNRIATRLSRGGTAPHAPTAARPIA